MTVSIDRKRINPALMPLVSSPAKADIVIVQINQRVRHDTLTSARDFLNRVNEISFSTAMTRDLRARSLMPDLSAIFDDPSGASPQVGG